MTALLRCRGSTAEMARLFDAVADDGLDWRETIWTGDPVPIVIVDGKDRRLTTSRWGLPEEAYAKAVAAKQHGLLYSRDLVPDASRLHDPAHLRRCLLIVESFAYPEGRAGERTRTWFGLWDSALAAWAGYCTPDGACCAGILLGANDRVEPYSEMMPHLLAPADQARWLDGGGQLSLGPAYDADAFYRENLGERWSTGRLVDEGAAVPIGPRG
jgi:putative SOS response-associated peptidase YedK